MRELAIFSGDERKQRSSISTDDQLTEEQARLSRLGAFLFDRHHRFHLYVKYLVFWARNAKNNRLLFPPVCSRKGKRSIILKEAASVCVGPPAELILSCHKVGTWRGVCLEGGGGRRSFMIGHPVDWTVSCLVLHKATCPPLSLPTCQLWMTLRYLSSWAVLDHQPSSVVHRDQCQQTQCHILNHILDDWSVNERRTFPSLFLISDDCGFYSTDNNINPA